jgi:cytochrome c-type biogenesis protein CcmH
MSIFSHRVGHGLTVARPCIALLITMLIALCGVGVAQAQPPVTENPVTDNDVNRVQERLFCPVCENLPLEACREPACDSWRSDIRRMLSEGMTDDQIVAYFVDRFGWQVVGNPTDPTLQFLTIGIPAVIIALIGAVAAISITRWRIAHQTAHGTPEADPTAPTLQYEDEYAARFDAEVNKRT